MTEHKLFTGEVPYVSTAEFHADRERAPHLEQEWHRPRLLRAAQYVQHAVDALGGENVRISDLGCGDGGLLQLIRDIPHTYSWGYDFCPANVPGWEERNVTARLMDVFGDDFDMVQLGHISVMTEVLEHVADPHAVALWVRQSSKYLVCSSPWNESPGNACAEHAWAWDMEGYAQLLQDAGWEIVRHEQVGLFQVVLAR